MAKPADWYNDRRTLATRAERQEKDRGWGKDRTEENDGQTTDGNESEQTVNTIYITVELKTRRGVLSPR